MLLKELPNFGATLIDLKNNIWLLPDGSLLIPPAKYAGYRIWSLFQTHRPRQDNLPPVSMLPRQPLPYLR